MSERSGKWYLLWMSFDSLENHVGQACVQNKIELLATDEATALCEAREKWEARMTSGTYRGWDKKTYPREPQLIYEVPFSQTRAHLVPHHNVPNCTTILSMSGFCSECQQQPDKQFIRFCHHCPSCSSDNVLLEDMTCPNCKETFKRAD